MAFDPVLTSKLVSGIVGAVATIVKVALEARAKVVFYIQHTATHILPATDTAPAVTLNTHCIVLRNDGRKAATNVRLSHWVLPGIQPVHGNFTIMPGLGAKIEPNQTSAPDIVIPILPPGVEVQVSYIYFPPLVWNQVGSHICSDEGVAKAVTVIAAPRPSRLVRTIAGVLMLAGLVAITYVVALMLIPHLL
jgi:hypothetical protein